MARDLRVEHFLSVHNLTGEEFWIRVAPHDQITARFPGLAERLEDPYLSDLPVVPAEQQFTLVLDSPEQMDELRAELQITPVRNALEAAEQTGKLSSGFSVDLDRDGSFIVSVLGNLTGGDLALQMQSVTNVLQEAGYQVTPDEEEPSRSVRAKLAR